MKTLSEKLPPRKQSAKQFLLDHAPAILLLFDVPKSIYGFNVEQVIRKQVHAMSEENAARKLDRLKELLQKWQT